MNAHDPKMHDSGRSIAASPAVGSLSQQNSKAQFEEARRYTRRVKSLKIAFPIVGAILVIGFVVIAAVSQFLSTPLGIAAIDLTNGQVVMDRPTLNGFTSSNASYEIVADKALQDLTDPKTVLLEKIGATLTLEDGNVASVEATQGQFHIDDENLRLSEGVKLHMSSGYAAELDNAHIDVKAGILTSEGQIAIESAMGDIRANRLEVRENGEYVLFEDRVKLLIRPEQVRPIE